MPGHPRRGRARPRSGSAPARPSTAGTRPRRPIDVDAIRAGTGTSDLLDQALTALTDPDRIAVVLCDALGMSVAECGRICRTPDPITRMHLSRGRKTLLAVLGATEPIAFATDEAEQVHDLVFVATTQDDALAIAQHCDGCVCCRSAQEGLTVLRARLQQHRFSVDAR